MGKFPVFRSLGDGLFEFLGSDIVCARKRLGTDYGKGYVTFIFDDYDIKVEWDETEKGQRRNPRWTRIYH